MEGRTHDGATADLNDGLGLNITTYLPIKNIKLK
jgi:hypothetical protein